MNIVLGITGSIAAYRAADLASQLSKLGHTVHCVMSQAATEFITPLTLQTLSRNPVLVSLEDEKNSWKPGHIELADNADLLLIAPASANYLGLLANEDVAPPRYPAQYRNPQTRWRPFCRARHRRPRLWLPRYWPTCRSQRHPIQS